MELSNGRKWLENSKLSLILIKITSKRRPLGEWKRRNCSVSRKESHSKVTDTMPHIVVGGSACNRPSSFRMRTLGRKKQEECSKKRPESGNGCCMVGQRNASPRSKRSEGWAKFREEVVGRNGCSASPNCNGPKLKSPLR